MDERVLLVACPLASPFKSVVGVCRDLATPWVAGSGGVTSTQAATAALPAANMPPLPRCLHLVSHVAINQLVGHVCIRKHHSPNTLLGGGVALLHKVGSVTACDCVAHIRTC